MLLYLWGKKKGLCRLIKLGILRWEESPPGRSRLALNASTGDLIREKEAEGALTPRRGEGKVMTKAETAEGPVGGWSFFQVTMGKNFTKFSSNEPNRSLQIYNLLYLFLHHPSPDC